MRVIWQRNLFYWRSALPVFFLGGDGGGGNVDSIFRVRDTASFFDWSVITYGNA